MNTRWNAAEGTSAGVWLEIDFGAPTMFDRTVIYQFEERIIRYRVQYWDGAAWREACSGGPMAAVQRDQFPAVKGTRLRLLLLETRGGQTPSIYSLGCFRAAATQ
jgi:hypothetical protein